MLSVDECLAAMEQCDAPVVSICGGEPLEYPEIGALARAILARGKAECSSSSTRSEPVPRN